MSGFRLTFAAVLALAGGTPAAPGAPPAPPAQKPPSKAVHHTPQSLAEMLAAPCEATASLACSWVAEFRDAGPPDLTPGRWWTIGRSFTFARVGDPSPRESFLVLHVGRSSQGTGLLGHDPEPEDADEAADIAAYAAALEAKEAPPENGFSRYIAAQRVPLVRAVASEQSLRAGYTMGGKEMHLSLRQRGDAYYALVLQIDPEDDRKAVFLVAKLPRVAGPR